MRSQEEIRALEKDIQTLEKQKEQAIRTEAYEKAGDIKKKQAEEAGKGTETPG